MIDFSIEALELAAKIFNPEPLGHFFLDGRYDWQKITNGSEWPYYRFFTALARLMKPAIVVELGGFQGTAAAHFAAGWPETTVITIDHHTDPGDEYNQVRMLAACEQFSNIKYIQGWTNPELATSQYGHHALGNAPDALPEVKKAGKIDILFIDSWHTYDNAKLDWQYYRPLLNSPALVICDDIQGGGGGNDPIQGMLDFWLELPEPKFLNANLHPATNMGFIKL